AKVDRALRAGALALGATVEIDTLPGYLPLACDATMARYFKANAVALVGEAEYRELGHRTGSTDMGDLSQIMPVLHPYMGGARGTGHAADYAIVDKPLAYVAPAKALASMVVDMLADDAAGAREVLARAAPRLDRQAYLALQRGMARRERYDGAAA
ncbi:MAG TPA: amidohydrolase, partial [Candidatus Methylomirabilis sp.]|nr:amidohydrolase [Candidatus Methylomirabilis sp.]